MDWTILPGLVASGAKPRIAGFVDGNGFANVLVIKPKYAPWDTFDYRFTREGVMVSVDRWYWRESAENSSCAPFALGYGLPLAKTLPLGERKGEGATKGRM